MIGIVVVGFISATFPLRLCSGHSSKLYLMSLYAAPASYMSVSFETFANAGVSYYEKSSDNLASSSGLEIKIVYRWNSSNCLVRSTLGTIGQSSRHFEVRFGGSVLTVLLNSLMKTVKRDLASDILIAKPQDQLTWLAKW
jgi:hypothetical protein